MANPDSECIWVRGNRCPDEAQGRDEHQAEANVQQGCADAHPEIYLDIAKGLR